jgi:hypothetical protein
MRLKVPHAHHPIALKHYKLLIFLALRKINNCNSPAAQGLTFLVNEGQQRQNAGALDRFGQVTLLLGSQTRDAAGQDFATLGDKFSEQVHIFVIDGFFGLEGRNATTKVSHRSILGFCWND